ncbi:MAG: hypothetical protein ACON4N_16065 [Myxococcota bacterium]
MDASIALFQELCRREHALSVVFYTNPDQNEFWASMGPIKELVVAPWFPDGFTGREFGFFGKGVFPEGRTERVLLAVESYKGPEGKPLFVGYFGTTRTSLDGHLSLACRRFTVGDTNRVFGQETFCIECYCTGKVLLADSGNPGDEDCPQCGGRGWESWAGVGEPPELGERIEARALVRVTNELDQPAWNQMFPDGDGLDG